MKHIVLCSLALGLACASILEASAQTIGIVSMERVLQESDRGKAVQTTLEERFGEQQQAFAEREREIRQLQAALDRDKPLMSKAQVEKKDRISNPASKPSKKTSPRCRKRSWQHSNRKDRNCWSRLARRSIRSQRKKDWGRFEASRSGLMYLGESADITDDVIKQMNAN